MVEVLVYGAEQICPSCVNFPSSQETSTWLEAVMKRKYGEQVRVRYVDIFQPEGKEEILFSQRVIKEDLWYPVVVIEGEIVGEGNPRIKDIQKKLADLGLTEISG